MEKDLILFDLDGTLTDPMVGITKSVQYALRAYGVEVKDLRQLCCFIGPPLKQSFMEYCHFSEKDAKDAIHVYREYFTERGMYENKVYDGVVEMLGQLRQCGISLMVATSKPELFSRQILDHFDLSPYFDFIGGADMEERRVEKADVIRYVLEEKGIDDCSRVVMVGDRKHDVIGARMNHVSSIGVLYGYGSRKELEEAGADAIASSVRELHSLLMTRALHDPNP